jgi:transglutaminase-like putative cysteine protease
VSDADDPRQFLAPTRYVDSDTANIVALSRQVARAGRDDIASAVALYHVVRDDITYTPYCDYRSLATFRASAVLERGAGFCVGKAAVLAAVARVAGIPARVGFADVRNHLCTPRLRELVGGEVFYFHGFTELFLDGRWVKATPAFDRTLCEKFGVPVLPFDGRTDSLFQPFDQQGRRHMEYVADRGSFVDVPAEEIVAVFHREYPRLMAAGAAASATRFRAEAGRTPSGS